MINTAAQQVSFLPVPPSRFVRLILGPLTALLNPLVGVLAGRRFVPTIARVHHLGRRSGKTYMTPTAAAVVGDTLVIPLSFGNVSDWTRNVRAAGQCLVQLAGSSYRATQPRFVDAAEAKPTVRQAFNAINRLGFTLFGVRQFLFLHIIEKGIS